MEIIQNFHINQTRKISVGVKNELQLKTWLMKPIHTNQKRSGIAPDYNKSLPVTN